MPAAVVADLELLEVVDLLAVAGVGLHVDLPGAAEAVEVVDVQRAQVDLQRDEDLGHRHALDLGLGAVDVEEQPGGVGAEAAEQARPARGSRPASSTIFSPTCCRAGRPLSPRSSMMILKPPAVPRPSIGGAPKHVHQPVLDLLPGNRPASGRRWPRRKGPRAARLVEVVEHHVHGAEVRGVGAQQDRLAGDGHGVLHAGVLVGQFLDAVHHPLGPLHGGRVGQLHVHQQVALVLHGDEARRATS